MEKEYVAKILAETGLMLELKGENLFKVRAYHQGARKIGSLLGNLAELAAENKLLDVQGIGKGLLENVTEILATGELSLHNRLKKELPAGLFELLLIPGLGPKRVRVLYEKLEITTTGELEYACQENRLLDLAGFGPKMQEKVQVGIEFLKQNQGRFLWVAAHQWAEEIVAGLKQSRAVMQVSIAGSLRRCQEVVKDIDVVVGTDNPEKVTTFLATLPLTGEIYARGETKVSARLTTGINIDLLLVEPQQFTAALHHFTGSKEHNAALRKMMKKSKVKINEYGIFRNDQTLVLDSEKDFFAALGLEYIPPELRENRGEIEAARKNELPNLINLADLKGQFHIHTNYSDGLHPIEELVGAAWDMGYSYLGISDHSRSAIYARGLAVENLQRQGEEIDRLREKYPDFLILKGVEADILPDGSIDYANKVLAGLDFVIASVHSHFRQTEAEMTGRIIKALTNPYVRVLGHPTGRILLGRPGYQINLAKILQVAAANEVVVELNASPYRLDLDWRYCRQAKELGVKLAINSDAHSKETLNDVRFGIMTARKGWVEAVDVLNTLPAKEIKQYFQVKPVN